MSEQITVHCYELIKTTWFETWWWKIVGKSRLIEHRILHMSEDDFATVRATFEVMVQINMCDVQIERACGCVFDVGIEPQRGRLCDKHWFEWVLERTRTAKAWKGITWNNQWINESNKQHTH